MNLLLECILETYKIVRKHIENRRQISKLICRGKDRDLYLTCYGNKYWLDANHYLDNEIIQKGIWENDSTKIVSKYVRDGNVVLDVGANIGYYSVQFAKLVGKNGKVLAFEPTEHFRGVLHENLKANDISNCTVYPFGLSDHVSEQEISIGENSATLHWSGTNDEKIGAEMIALKALDEIVDELNVDKIDFIKIDVDGHEPAFLKGAMKTLKKYKPMVLLEISHMNYLEYGITAWEFYDYVKENGFNIYYEEDFAKCDSKRDFLRRCGNFAYSSNIILSERELK